MVAPVPWFPLHHPRFGAYAQHAKVPRAESRAGIQVLHPRYPVVPKVGMNVSPMLLAAAVRPAIARLIEQGFDFDLIDAHYFYPDGVAAAMLGKYFNKPVVITARGSDITLLPHYAVPRKLIGWAARRAAAVITVCNALRDEVVALGVDPAKVTSLRNGVDLELFRPVERDAVRARLGLHDFTLLAVGHLVPVKAQQLAVAALTQLPDVRLLIAGNGPNRGMLLQLAQDSGVAERVSFLGALPQVELRDYYGAADALVLPSEREGWANVLLEAMACGTPVIASRVWGTPEVVATPEAGLLMHERTAAGVADAVRALRANYPDRAATRRYGQLLVFRRVLAARDGVQLR